MADKTGFFSCKLLYLKAVVEKRKFEKILLLHFLFFQWQKYSFNEKGNLFIKFKFN